MPLPKWMKHEKNRPFEPHKKARKQENFYSDFNLEIRTISPGSNSLGTESFLSSDSFSSEKISVDLVYKENTNPSVPQEGQEDNIDFIDAPNLQSETIDDIAPKENINPLKNRVKKTSQDIVIEKEEQMFFTSKGEYTEKNDFFHNNNKFCRFSSHFVVFNENEHLVRQKLNSRSVLSHEKFLSEESDGENKIDNKMITDAGVLESKNKQEEFMTSTENVVENILRVDQINKVSPLIFTKSNRNPQETRVLNKKELSLAVKLPNSNMNERKDKKISESKEEKWIWFTDDSSKPRTNERIMTLQPVNNENLLSSPSREEWISFEDESTSFELTKESSIIEDDSDSKRLISKDESSDVSKEMNISLENILNIVKEPLKGSNSKRKADDEKNLVSVHGTSKEESESEISDDIVSLDYESEEERKKLRDTPLKQYPDVELFQATSAVKRECAKRSLSDTSNQINSCKNDIDMSTLDDYPDKCPKNSWSFWYRYPDQKKRVGSRKWYPVNVTVDGDFIKVNGQTKTGITISREIPLHPFFVFTLPTVHNGNRDGKMYSTKLQYVKYKEIRKFRTKTKIEHLPVYTPVLKLATRDFISLREFINKVESIIRHIPTYRDKGITYRHEEIFIDCDDECQYLLTGEGEVLKYNVTVQMRLRVFVTGTPQLRLYLNDVCNQEALAKVKELSHLNTKSSKSWIKPLNYEFHPCVDSNASKQYGTVVFVPPDGCSFELLRFRVPHRNPLPVIAKSSLEVLSNNSVRLNASIQVTGSSKTIRHKRNDVTVFFPIPSSWGVLFVRSRNFSGKKKYIKVKADSNHAALSVATLNRVTLQISTGVAKYDPAFSAVVWRLGTLPIIHGNVAADAVHVFQCLLELPFSLEIRDEFQPYTFVEFNVGHQLASGVSIEEILLSDGKIPDKWVCYRSNFSYKISMKLIENGKEL